MQLATTYDASAALSDRPIQNVACAPLAGDTFATTGSPEKVVRVWDLATQQRVTRSDEHSHMVHSIAWNPCEAGQLLLGLENGGVVCWDPRSSSSSSTHDRRLHMDCVTRIAWRPDGRWFATASRDQSLKVWDTRCTARPLQAFLDSRLGGRDGTEHPTSLAWHPQSDNVFVSGSSEGTITYWSCDVDASSSASTLRLVTPSPRVDEENKEEKKKKGEEEEEEKKKTTPATTPATTTNAKPRRRLEASRPIGEMFLAHRGRVSDLAFHPEGHLLGSVGADSTMKVWAQCFPDTDFENRFEVRQLPLRRQPSVVRSLGAGRVSFGSRELWQSYASSIDSNVSFPPAPSRVSVPFF